jgi:sialate O-acetylesterase
MSRNELQKYDFVKIPTDTSVIKPAHKKPMLLYNAMLAPIMGYGIRGVVWYQGEANRYNSEQYALLFPGLINSWRKEWDIGDFPFYYAQIAPFGYTDAKSAFLREVQLNTAALVANVGMACLMDVGNEFCIHPPHKKEAGERLAYQAVHKTYGVKGIVCDGPMFEEMKIDGNQVTISFSRANNGLTTFGKELTNFKIAGNDKIFYRAKAKINKKGEVVVSSPEVKKPVAVRYCFENYAIGELYNTAGLPASSFRTDDWNE